MSWYSLRFTWFAECESGVLGPLRRRVLVVASCWRGPDNNHMSLHWKNVLKISRYPPLAVTACICSNIWLSSSRFVPCLAWAWAWWGTGCSWWQGGPGGSLCVWPAPCASWGTLISCAPRDERVGSALSESSPGEEGSGHKNVHNNNLNLPVISQELLAAKLTTEQSLKNSQEST